MGSISKPWSARFGPQPPSRVVHVLHQACESLAEAHATGLVHRDIKPANLHLCRLGLTYDFVKVLDFGLAKRGSEGGSAQTLLTAPETTTGTPAYMPPELASGESMDGRGDLYSLGCVAYFLLTGKLVFEGDNALRMILQHVQKEPVAPSVRSGLPIPASLDRLILQCLAKDPGARPATATALAAELTDIDVETRGRRRMRAHGGMPISRRVLPPRRRASPPLRSMWPTES